MSDSPIRVLQILRAPVGGLFRHVSDLTIALAQRGHAIGIVADALAGDAQTEARLDLLRNHATLGIHRYPMPRVLGWQDAVYPLSIRSLAKRLDIDILHGHGAKGGFGARLAAMGTPRRALYTPHGGALHYDKSRLSGRAFLGIEKALLSQTDAVIFESHHAQAAFAEKIALPSCRHLVIHNGVAPDEFEPVVPADDAADFVFIGELRALKGIDLLVDALARVVAPDGRPATLVMAGDGPDAASLRDRIDRLALSSRVRLAGAQPARAMFAQGRCVVVPSRAESLPYIVLEAAAAGRPLIATRVGGIAEIFGPTADSLVPAESVEALARAMQAFLDAPARSTAEAETRRAYVDRTFSVTRMTDDLERLYNAVLNRA